MVNQAVVFCGGMGTRMGDLTSETIKPLIDIQDKPLVDHVLDIYRSIGVDNFLLLGGYRWQHLLEPYITYPNVSVVNTGEDTPKGARLIQVLSRLHATFFLTYADGLIDLSPREVESLHAAKGYSVTLTAVRPPSRFGCLHLRFTKVKQIQEKPQTTDSWINGGFMVVNRSVVEDARNLNETDWERQTLSRLANSSQLGAYKHTGNWICADTPRDVQYLRQLCASGTKFWKTNVQRRPTC